MSLNPFELFSIKPVYAIDMDAVQSKYLALQKQFHPDNYAAKTSKEKLMATQISANISEAHKILIDPVARATALINLGGMEFSLNEYISHDKTLLIEQMTLREQLESATAEKLPALLEEYKQVFNMLETKLMNALDAQKWHDAADVVLRMRYYQKLQTELIHQLHHG